MSENNEIKVRVTYEKTMQSRYIAHLDTIDIISKALRRLQLPYQVTSGCHIRPKISFGAPLPLGHASLCEQFVLSLSQPIEGEWLQKALSEQLPQGMKILSVEIPCSEDKKGANGDLVKYRLGFTAQTTANRAQSFLENPETAFSLVSKGKVRNFKLGNSVQSISKTQSGTLCVLEVEFIQGRPEVPSVSKIVTALADFLEDEKDGLVLIERISLLKL